MCVCVCVRREERERGEGEGGGGEVVESGEKVGCGEGRKRGGREGGEGEGSGGILAFFLELCEDECAAYYLRPSFGPLQVKLNNHVMVYLL